MHRTLSALASARLVVLPDPKPLTASGSIYFDVPFSDFFHNRLLRGAFGDPGGRKASPLPGPSAAFASSTRRRSFSPRCSVPAVDHLLAFVCRHFALRRFLTIAATSDFPPCLSGAEPILLTSGDAHMGYPRASERASFSHSRSRRAA